MSRWAPARAKFPRQRSTFQPVQDLLMLMLQNLEAGNAVSIMAEEDQPLATQRAADILCVSRPFLVRLVDSCVIPFHRVGSHRRLYLRDVPNYKRMSL